MLKIIQNYSVLYYILCRLVKFVFLYDNKTPENFSTSFLSNLQLEVV